MNSTVDIKVYRRYINAIIKVMQKLRKSGVQFDIHYTERNTRLVYVSGEIVVSRSSFY